MLCEPRCPIQAFHPQGERRGPAFLDFGLAGSGTLARVSEESGLALAPGTTSPGRLPSLFAVGLIGGYRGIRLVIFPFRR